jgi:nucleolar pre-ribosomal-associated protein 1
MLYAAGQGSRRERRWMVRFLRDSVCSRAVRISLIPKRKFTDHLGCPPQDWQICKRRHTFALLASLFQSSSDHNIHPLIAQALAAITSVPEAAIHLVEKEGLVEWLEMADVTVKRAELLPYVLQILDNAVSALIQRDMSKSSKLFATERRWHLPVLNCLQKLGTTSSELFA